MSSEVNIIIKSDSTQVKKDIDDVESKVDSIVGKWKIARLGIEIEIGQTLRNISSIISTFRGVISAMGLTLDPWWNAMTNLVSATISSLFAIGLALSASGVGLAVSPLVFAASAGLSIFMVGKMAVDFGRISAEVATIARNLAFLEDRISVPITPFSGGF